MSKESRVAIILRTVVSIAQSIRLLDRDVMLRLMICCDMVVKLIKSHQINLMGTWLLLHLSSLDSLLVITLDIQPRLFGGLQIRQLILLLKITEGICRICQTDLSESLTKSDILTAIKLK